MISHTFGGGVNHHDSSQVGTIERCVVSVSPKCITCGASMNTLLSVLRYVRRGPGSVSFLTNCLFLPHMPDSCLTTYTLPHWTSPAAAHLRAKGAFPFLCSALACGRPEVALHCFRPQMLRIRTVNHARYMGKEGACPCNASEKSVLLLSARPCNRYHNAPSIRARTQRAQ